MEHVIGYDLARGLHIIAVIAWVAGLLMLPRFYAYITSSHAGGEVEQTMLKASRNLRMIILTPSIILAWAFGIFLFATYLVADWAQPVPGDFGVGAPLVLGQACPCVRLVGLPRLPICRGPQACLRATAALRPLLAADERDSVSRGHPMRVLMRPVSWLDARLQRFLDFGVPVSTADVIAPSYGTHKLADYFRALAGRRGQ